MRNPKSKRDLGRWSGTWRLVISCALTLVALARADATPRMISYGYTSCVSCHVSVQGRGLLNSYGRGIDIAQSYSKKDFTAMLLGQAAANSEDATDIWNGRLGNVLADFVISLRLNQRLDQEKTDPTLTALYRQVIFFGERDRFRLNLEVGAVDGGLSDVRLGPDLVATGGDIVFLKKLLLEWRLDDSESTSGKELAFGRDYLPLGLQIDDYATFILHLNRAGIYDFPLQLKYFVWNEKFLASVYVFGPSFQEGSNRREYGSGFLYECYPASKLALGIQGLIGFSEALDRIKVGPYLRWGISEKWALLAEADYGGFWNGETSGEGGNQVTTFLQLFYHHYEWLVSSVTVNYAYSDLLTSRQQLTSFRYLAAARLNRNLTLGATYLVGDARRSLTYSQELGVFANVKF